MVKIPEYTAQEGIQVNPKTMPDTTYAPIAAQALGNVGEQLSSFGEHLVARYQQKENTDAELAFQTLQTDAKVSSQESIDNNEADDGEGMTSAAMAAIDAKANPILKSLPARLQKEYATRIDNLKKEHSLVVSDEQNKKRYDHYGRETERVIGNKVADLTANPSSENFNKAKGELDKLIDGMPITPKQKQILRDKSDAWLAEGKAAGELKKDPNGLKKNLGAGGTITVPKGDGTPTSARRGKQLAFVWHELTGETGKQHGGGSEAAAYNHLKRATTLADALEAGFDYERPNVRNRDQRMAHAKRVLAGNASPEAMQARAYFESKGLSPVQASGLVGALMGESGESLDPNSHNPRDAGGGSYGIGQWNNGGGSTRRKNMENFTGTTSETGTTGDATLSTSGDIGTSKSDPAYDSLSVERRLQLINQADAEIKRNQADLYTSAASRVDQLGSDALTTYKMHGAVAGIEEPSLTDFVNANKGNVEEGGKAYQLFQSAKQAALLEYSFQNMTPDEIMAAVADAKAKIPIGPGSADAAKMFDAIQAEALQVAKPKAAHLEEQVAIRKQADVNWEQVHKEAEAVRAAKQKEIDDAANAVVEARTKEPYKWAITQVPTVRNAWDTVSEAPGNKAMTAAAVDATYKSQKNIQVPTENMELIPPEAAKQLVNSLYSDLEDVSTEQKMKNLADVITMTPNPQYQRIIFDQLKRAGLPNSMRYAVDAMLRGDVGSYSLLFNPALSKNLKEADSKKIKEIREKARTYAESPIGQAYFGSGMVSRENIDNTESAIDLISNTAIMIGGSDPDAAIKKAAQAVMGPVALVEATFGTGVKVSATVPNTMDEGSARRGFANLQNDVSKIMRSMNPSEDLSANIQVDQAMSLGSFTNHGNGYSFKLNDGTYLPDPKTGEILEWSIDDVTRASKKPMARTDADTVTRFGKTVPRYTGPGDYTETDEQMQKPGLETLEPPPYTKSILPPQEPRRNQF